MGSAHSDKFIVKVGGASSKVPPILKRGSMKIIVDLSKDDIKELKELNEKLASMKSLLAEDALGKILYQVETKEDKDSSNSDTSTAFTVNEDNDYIIITDKKGKKHEFYNFYELVEYIDSFTMSFLPDDFTYTIEKIKS